MSTQREEPPVHDAFTLTAFKKAFRYRILCDQRSYYGGGEEKGGWREGDGDRAYHWKLKQCCGALKGFESLFEAAKGYILIYDLQ